MLPYLAIYSEFGYFWHNFATKIFFWLFGLFGYLAFLATFKKLVKNWFWLDLIMLWCRYFCLLKELWCRYFTFLKVLWCRSFGVFYNLATFCSNFLATLTVSSSFLFWIISLTQDFLCEACKKWIWITIRGLWKQFGQEDLIKMSPFRIQLR